MQYFVAADNHSQCLFPILLSLHFLKVRMYKLPRRILTIDVSYRVPRLQYYPGLQFPA